MLKKWLYSVFLVLLFFGVGQSFAFEKEARGTELVDSWKKLDELGPDIPSAISFDLRIETKKLDELGSLISTVKQKFALTGIPPSWFDDLSEALLQKLKGIPSNQIDDFAGDLNAIENAIKQKPELVDSWKVLDDANSPLKTNIDELTDVSKHLDDIDNLGGYYNWRLRTGRSRHPNWTQIDDITNKIESRLNHVDYLDFKGNGFEGCHTQNAMDQFLGDNPGWTGGFIDRHGNHLSLLNNTVVEAYPWVKDINGNLYTKLNGAQNTINGVQYGKASFFPKNWNTAKLKREVEHAISNNHGLVSGNTYRGYSTDGTIEINFYYNTSTGRIISFFPKL